MFALIFIGTAGLLAAYVAWRLLRTARISRTGKLAAVAAIAFVVLCTPLTIMLRSRGVENTVVDLVAWAGYIGLGFLSFVLTFLVLREGLLVPAVVFQKAASYWRRRRGQENQTQSPDIDRRRFLTNGINTGILATAGVLTGYGVSEAKQIPDVKRVTVALPGLPVDLEGFRIVQLSDIHVSPTLKRPFVEGVVAVVNQLAPDLVALTGDLVDGSVNRLAGDVAPLADIRSAHGNFFVTGNHEYYSNAPDWIEKMRSLGFIVLLNENRIISRGQGRLLVAGVTDYRAGRFYPEHASDPEKAIRNSVPVNSKILLAHQPKSIFAAQQAGFDLQISGHTHGGQFFPWNLFVGYTQPFVAGLHRYKDTQIYISSGTGYWGPPLRVGSPSEITLLTLVPA